MAITKTYAVGTDPADLVAALSLEISDSYICEVVAGNPPVHLFEGGNSAPTDRSFYHVILPGAAGRLGVIPVTTIWVWAPSPLRLVVTHQ